MIEPYGTALKNIEPQLQALGFTLVRDSEYGACFSIGAAALEISTERYYHPSISTTFLSKNGKGFHLGFLEELLDPDLHEKHKTQFDALGLDRSKRPTEAMTKQYAQTALLAVVDLFSKHAKRILEEPQTYEAQYAAAEKSRLAAFMTHHSAT